MYNTLIKTLSSTLKENTFELPELAFNTVQAKRYALILALLKSIFFKALILWIHVHIRFNPTKFISTQQLYNLYEETILSLNFIAKMEQQSFFKEISNVLIINKILAGKSRNNGKRGFEGIEYISCSHIYSKKIK